MAGLGVLLCGKAYTVSGGFGQLQDIGDSGVLDSVYGFALIYLVVADCGLVYGPVADGLYRAVNHGKRDFLWAFS